MLCLVILTHVLPVYCMASVAHKVVSVQYTDDNGTCYRLYEADREVITWNEAYDYCKKTYQSLAIIEDDHTQNIIKLLNSLSRPVGDGHAWVAGRRSNDTSWYDVTGNTYTGRIYESYKPSQTRCVQLYQHNRTRQWSRLEAQPCYAISTDTLSRALCQYNMTSELTSCPGYNQSGICYVATSSYLRTWYDARTYCMTSYPGGSLAYTSLSSESLRDYFWMRAQVIQGISRNLWVGIERNTWKWIKDDTEVSLVYDAWYPEEGAGLNEDCVLVDLNAGCSWADKACGYTSSYFICQHNASIDIDALNTSEPPSTTAEASTQDSVTVTTSEGGSKTDWSLTVIACTVLGSLFLVLLLALVTCAVRDRRKLSKSLLLRLLAYDRFGKKNRQTPYRGPGDAENAATDWAEIIAADGLDRRSLDGQMSDTSGLSLRVCPSEDGETQNTTGTAGGTPARSPDEPMAGTSGGDRTNASGQKQSPEETYMSMTKCSIKSSRSGLEQRPGYSIPGYVQNAMTRAEICQEAVQEADSSADRSRPSPPTGTDDPMYVVRITLPQKEVAHHVDRHETATDQSRPSASDVESLYAVVKRRQKADVDSRPVVRQDVMSDEVKYVECHPPDRSSYDAVPEEIRQALRQIDQIE